PVATTTFLPALGRAVAAVLGATVIVTGLAIVLVRGGSLRRGGTLTVLGVALMTAGALICLGRHGPSGPFIAPGAVLGALLLVIGPWLWRLTAERTERIRLQERAEVAARVHDSVLQALATVH